MTGLLIALAVACGIGCCVGALRGCVLALRSAFARTQPDLLLAIARPAHTAESVESRLTAQLLDGDIDAAQYRTDLARLAASDVPVLVRP